MDLLELPLEAVAFRLYSLPTAAASASVWTCLAVVAAAAAAGLWRYRSSGITSPKPDLSSLGATTQKYVPLSSEPAPAALADETLSQAQTRASGSAPASPSKIRFTAYYDAGDESCCTGPCCMDDEETTEMAVDDGFDGDVMEVVTAPAWLLEKAMVWDPMVVRRRGDLGLYRYQDITALNGNVVRLWDGVDGGLTWNPPRRRGGLGISVSSF